MNDHSKIETRPMPKVEYHDTNGDHVLDDRDDVTISWRNADGTTSAVHNTADQFAKTGDNNRNLVIELAKKQNVNTTLFAEKHPLTK